MFSSKREKQTVLFAFDCFLLLTFLQFDKTYDENIMVLKLWCSDTLFRFVFFNDILQCEQIYGELIYVFSPFATIAHFVKSYDVNRTTIW